MACSNYVLSNTTSKESYNLRVYISADKFYWDNYDIKKKFSQAVSSDIFVESIVGDQITCFCYAENVISAGNIIDRMREFYFPVLMYHTDELPVLKSVTEMERFKRCAQLLMLRAERQILEIQVKLRYQEKTLKVFKHRCDSLLNNVRTLDPKYASESQLHNLEKAINVECRRLANPLPVYTFREEILRKVSENKVSIIIGETGSGKSTQLVQYLYEAGLAGNKRIVCTQPRKVAAISLAKRVAEEMDCSLGELVGYKTGAKKNSSSLSKILFVTDQCLFNECLSDQEFTNYSCIIIDEAHERSIYSDLLLSMIKKCLRKRSDLTVIITSATISPQIFIDYFSTTPELRIPGTVFPVEVIYENGNVDYAFRDYEKKAVEKALIIHESEGPGDILVFLTSPVETLRCCQEFEKLAKDSESYQCFTLFGQMSSSETNKVFQPLPSSMRKILFATNCAETGITIDGIKFVIDTGLVKVMKYDPEQGISILRVCTISKSSADQRKGRAGRTSKGKCFRLYLQETYESMELMSRPEIFRINLGEAALKMAAKGIDFFSFEFVEPPPQESVTNALKTLQMTGAISSQGITDIGRWISKLNCDPRLGNIIYLGYIEKVLYDSVVAASLLSIGGNVFYRGLEKSEQQLYSQIKNQYDSMDGDIFTWINVYKDWIQQPKHTRLDWSLKRSINYKMLQIAKDWIKDTYHLTQ